MDLMFPVHSSQFTSPEAEKKLNIDKCLSNYIVKSYEENKQTVSEWMLKRKLLRMIRRYIEGPFRPEIQRLGLRLNAVLPFGSTITNLGTIGSDLDIVISLTQVQQILVENDEVADSLVIGPNSVLSPLYLQLKNNALKTSFKTIAHIKGARVPIITGELSGVKLDISVYISPNLPPAYITAQMINSYSIFDHRFDPLCAFVKKWTKNFGNSCTSHLEMRMVKNYLPPSSTTTLLVIHFLQYKGIIPNLHEKRVDAATWNLTSKRDKTSSVGNLFREFLVYYVKTVSLEKEAFISNINDGKNSRKRVTDYLNILRIALEQLEKCREPTMSARQIMNLRVRVKSIHN